ncbi:MAG: TPM domain-containing protein [bacterium]
MRRAVLLFVAVLFFASAAHAADIKFPAYSGYVNDYANVLDSAIKAKLEAACTELEKKSTAEMAIAIVQTAEPLIPKEYATELFKKWGVGKKGKDNGVLVLLAMQERRVEIEVGYGLEGILTDGVCGRVLDEYVIPYFKQGKFGEGLYNGALALSGKIMEGSGDKMSVDASAPVTDTSTASTSSDDWPDWVYTTITLIGVCVIFASFIIAALVQKPLMSGLIGALGWSSFGILAQDWTVAGILAVIGFVISFFVAFGGASSGGGGSSSSSSFGGWSSGGGGGGGGGFGGFGGGSSGGGGAGRSW